eukprot:scaffold311792_cov39-Tisochrysis_lutea.AAC.4
MLRESASRHVHWYCISILGVQIFERLIFMPSSPLVCGCMYPWAGSCTWSTASRESVVTIAVGQILLYPLGRDDAVATTRAFSRQLRRPMFRQFSARPSE